MTERHHHHLTEAELEVREARAVALGQGNNKDGTPTLSVLLREEVAHGFWLEHEMDLEAAEQFHVLVGKHVENLRVRTASHA